MTHDDGLALSPAWAPDGRFLYFASSRGGTLNIWKLALSGGGEPEQITAGQGDDAQLDVSADGRKIVFSTWRDNVNIAQLDLNAPSQPRAQLLTTDPARNQIQPSYSPDGKYVAYFSNLSGVEKEGIWISNTDGSSPTQLVRDDRFNVFPAWTPDSSHLIYQAESDTPDGDEYRIVPISGGAPETVLKNGPDRYFDVGSDGRLLFRGADNAVDSFDARTGRTQTLGSIATAVTMAPLRWSPDEKLVAYLVAPTRDDDPAAGLWVTDFAHPARQLFRGWVDWWMARGPDGELYFLQGQPDLNGTLWKVRWDGSGLSRVGTTIPMIYSYWADPAQNPQDHFAVSPDGRHVAYDFETVLTANIGMIEKVR